VLKDAKKSGGSRSQFDGFTNLFKKSFNPDEEAKV